jgi:hypothetical protein
MHSVTVAGVTSRETPRKPPLVVSTLKEAPEEHTRTLFSREGFWVATGLRKSPLQPSGLRIATAVDININREARDAYRIGFLPRIS